MYRTLRWGGGEIFFRHFNLLKSFEKCGTIKISAITSNSTVFDSIAGIPFVAKKDIVKDDYDIVIAMSEKYLKEMVSEACDMGFSPEQVISYKALVTPNVNLEKYMELKKNVPTIFCMNCWGAATYHQLGLEFVSPFITTSVSDNDFLQFLHRPKWYMEQSLEFSRMDYNTDIDIEFPICMWEGIELWFSHHTSYELAVADWEKRKKRINWNNIFIAMYTENPRIAEEFDKLDYEKKVCFTTFKSNLKSVCTLEFAKKNEMKDKPFWYIVNSMASGVLPYYDSVELLLNGRIKRIGEIGE
jgi:uncharacterized protein (DUF1919 family)